MALKINNELNGLESGTIPSASTADPDAMDISAMRGQLSESERSRMMREGLCFCCGKQGHQSRECPDKGKGKGAVRVAEMEEQSEEVREWEHNGGVKKRRSSGLMGMPLPSSHKELLVSVGASDLVNSNTTIDPRLFISFNLAPHTLLEHTTTNVSHPTRFLVDSGATHNVLSLAFVARAGLLALASSCNRTIAGFDGLTKRSSYELDLRLDHSTEPAKFIVTQLKDSYDGILGMPWIKLFGHRIDWRTCYIATTEAVLSYPTKALSDGREPVRQARIIDEGVCASRTLALPQCKLDFIPLPAVIESTGKQDPLLENTTHRTPTNHTATAGNLDQAEDLAAAELASSYPTKASLDGEEPVRQARIIDEGVHTFSGITPPQCESPPHQPLKLNEAAGKLLCPLELETLAAISTTKASWSTSAWIAAKAKQANPVRRAEEIVPQRYHRYLHLFRKIGAQKLPPRRQYDF
ncbi:hypothetical protein PTTG_29405 [Puccinia triticina 1-1 BBBD Race 1]|uniref:CCHC-type domain-containing protein n=1 Tax=Puccinia triticina (isolate 1-1 / race 1 (BBBD)) TaxID=630390 RepID=A0A180G6M6_PUCT1|nr:hypothetical protein PTTG_29405 [Puccinia triticina 1-1 BBBD Race 1]